MALTSLLSAGPSDEQRALLGEQHPRTCHVPEYVESSGDEAIELAAMAGLDLDPWQRFVLRGMLGERPDGKWSAQTVALIVGRQNGKGAILEARELFGLFVLGERLILHTAHEQKTATNHFRRLLQLIEHVPEFESRVRSAPRGKGSEAIELHDGAMIFFSTRTGGGGRGLSADLTVYDEAMHLSEVERSALTPTRAALSMHGNTQSVYAGSAVDQLNPKHDGVPFAKVREAGLSENPSVALFEWSAPGEDPARVPRDVMLGPEFRRMANPGLNIRISYEFTELERTVEMSNRGFAVERLGIGDWPDTSEEAGRVIGRAAWEALAERDPENRITGVPVFAIDASPTQAWASIAVAGKRDDGLFQVAVVEHRPDVDWVVDRCAELRRENRGSRFVVDKLSTASALLDALKKAKVRVIETTSTEYGRACMQFFQGAVEQRFRYPFPQPELDEALNDARQQTMGDAWKWSRRNSESADISPLVAASLALWGAERAKKPGIVNLNDLD